MEFAKSAVNCRFEDQWAVWQRISGNTPDEDQEDERAFKGIPKVLFNTGEIEWYTPPEFIEAARAVLGAIDLDPASSDIAQERVRASVYYTKEDDGLTKAWAGRVWMNPPYAADLIVPFVEKLCHHFGNGDVTEAVVLVNNAMETGWAQLLSRNASAINFPSRRVRFIKPDGHEADSPLHGQAIFYLGDNVDSFLREFSEFGSLWISARARLAHCRARV
jgi:ParB family chromosome partitioning protein